MRCQARSSACRGPPGGERLPHRRAHRDNADRASWESPSSVIVVHRDGQRLDSCSATAAMTASIARFESSRWHRSPRSRRRAQIWSGVRVFVADRGERGPAEHQQRATPPPRSPVRWARRRAGGGGCVVLWPSCGSDPDAGKVLQMIPPVRVLRASAGGENPHRHGVPTRLARAGRAGLGRNEDAPSPHDQDAGGRIAAEEPGIGTEAVIAAAHPWIETVSPPSSRRWRCVVCQRVPGLTRARRGSGNPHGGGAAPPQPGPGSPCRRAVAASSGLAPGRHAGRRPPRPRRRSRR